MRRVRVCASTDYSMVIWIEIAFQSLIHPSDAPGLIRCIAGLNIARSWLVKVTGAVAQPRPFIVQSCILLFRSSFRQAGGTAGCT
jgi:hypothetical protein